MFCSLHVKATVFIRIGFVEQKQQFCARLPYDMKSYVNTQQTKTILEVIHHSIVASKIFLASKSINKAFVKGEKPHQGEKSSFKTNNEPKGGDKEREKGVYKAKKHLSPKEMEHYRKANRCYKCGEQGHPYRACSMRNTKKDNPQACIVCSEDPIKEESHLCYAWGKVPDQDVDLCCLIATLCIILFLLS